MKYRLNIFKKVQIVIKPIIVEYFCVLLSLNSIYFQISIYT